MHDRERYSTRGCHKPSDIDVCFDILLTILELARLTHRFYIKHGSDLSPVKPIAYADELLAAVADVSGLQQVSRVVSGFCVICNLTILPA
jgi:hypothetical protein